MKKLYFIALMLLGTMAAQAQDVLVSVYDTDRTAVEDAAISGKQTVETKTIIVQPAVSSASVTEDDVMEVTSEQPLEKAEVRKKETGEVIRTIDLAKAKQASIDLKPYNNEAITIVFFGENGETSEYTWD